MKSKTTVLAEILRLLRTRRDYKGWALANQLDISPAYLTQIEKGDRTPPLKILRRFAKVLKMPLSVIFSFEEEVDGLKKKADRTEHIQQLIGSYILGGGAL